MKQGVALRILVVVAALLVMGRVVKHEFTEWDDARTLWRNERMNPPTAESVAWYWTNPYMDLYVPVTQTAWAMIAEVAYRPVPDGQGSRLDPAVFHGANVLLHGLTALLVFELLWTLLGNPWGAAIGALLFAVHPVQVETVAWASGFKDLLCGFFMALALWQYARYAKGSKPAYALATGAAVVGMLSKPTAMVLPAMAMAIDVFVLRRDWRRSLRALAPWFVLSLACAAVAKGVQPAHVATAAPLWARPLIAGDSIAFYLGNLLVPWELAPVYGRTPAAVMGTTWFWLAWIIPAGLAAVLWWRRTSAGVLIAAGIVFLAGVAPVLGLVTFDFQVYSTVSDHYLYPAMIGVALAAAWEVTAAPRRGALIAAGVVLIALGARSFVQAGVWKNDETLWRHQVNVAPEHWAGWNGLGEAVRRKGDMGQAVEYYRESVKRHPAYARQNLAAALFFSGRKQEAVATLEEYLKIAEQLPENERGNMARMREMLDEFRR